MCLCFETFATMYKFFALAALVVVTVAEHRPQYGKPAEAYPDVDPQYKYAYAVKDGYSGADFQQTEERNGYNTAGYYRVVLPDSRVQIVKYSDQGDGNVAEVSYEGEARYDEPKKYPAPAPAYPQPSYEAQPTYARPVYKAAAPRTYH